MEYAVETLLQSERSQEELPQLNEFAVGVLFAGLQDVGYGVDNIHSNFRLRLSVGYSNVVQAYGKRLLENPKLVQVAIVIVLVMCLANVESAGSKEISSVCSVFNVGTVTEATTKSVS